MEGNGATNIWTCIELWCWANANCCFDVGACRLAVTVNTLSAPLWIAECALRSLPYFWVPCRRRDSWRPAHHISILSEVKITNVVVRRARPGILGVYIRRPPPHWPGQGTSGAGPRGARPRGARPRGAGPQERAHPSAAKTHNSQKK